MRGGLFSLSQLPSLLFCLPLVDAARASFPLVPSPRRVYKQSPKGHEVRQKANEKKKKSVHLAVSK